jgi:hypothetical protein
MLGCGTSGAGIRPLFGMTNSLIIGCSVLNS